MNMDAINTKPDIDEVVRKHGLTVDDLVKCGKGGLQATRTVRDKYGDKEEFPDWNVRHKFFASFLELLGYLKGNSTTVNVGITAQEKEKEEAYRQWRQQGEPQGQWREIGKG